MDNPFKDVNNLSDFLSKVDQSAQASSDQLSQFVSVCDSIIHDTESALDLMKTLIERCKEQETPNPFLINTTTPHVFSAGLGLLHWSQVCNSYVDRVLLETVSHLVKDEIENA